MVIISASVRANFVSREVVVLEAFAIMPADFVEAEVFAEEEVSLLEREPVQSITDIERVKRIRAVLRFKLRLPVML